MPAADPPTFTRLADGTTFLRREDGSYAPIHSETDRVRLAALSEAEVERIATSDPDHPGLDDEFWANIEPQPIVEEVISITLDDDVLAYFRREGHGYQSRINAVLRRYVEARQRR